MASSFLEKKAREREKVVAENFGAPVSSAAQSGGTNEIASSFLQRKAAERAAVVGKGVGTTTTYAAPKVDNSVAKTPVTTTQFDIGQARKNLEAKRVELKTAEQELANTRLLVLGSNSRIAVAKADEYKATTARHSELKKKVEALKKEVGLLEVKIDAEEDRQASSRYSAILSAPDFKEYSSKGAAIKNPTHDEVLGGFLGIGSKAGDIGNMVTYSRDNWRAIETDKQINQNASASQGSEITSSLSQRAVVGNPNYRFLTEDEVAIYNYLLSKEGGESAAKFLKFMEEEINRRAAGEEARQIEQMSEDIPGLGGVLEVGVKAGHSLETGIDQFAGGLAQLTTEERLPTSQQQFAAQALQEGMGKTGQILYQTGSTVGNQLVPIALSFIPVAGRYVSAAAMGASAAGNTYNQAMRTAEAEGYTREQAKTYAALVGVSETTLNALLSGVGDVAGLGEEKMLAKVAGLDKAFARLAATGAIRIGNELVEEELQLFIEPMLATVILDRDYEMPTGQEMWETAIITALSTSFMEGGSIAGVNIDYKRYGELLLQTHSENSIIGEALANTKPTGKAHQMAVEMEAQKEQNKALDPTDIGRLHVLTMAESKGKKYGNYAANNLVRKTDAKTETLVEMAKSKDAETAAYATAQLAHTEETVVSPIAQTLIDSSMKPADAVEQAALITKVQSGQTLSNTETKKLNLANESVRTVFKEVTGIEVTSEQAQNGSPKRQIIRRAEEVAKKKADTAAAEKAREAAVANERDEAEVIQQVQEQQAQAEAVNTRKVNSFNAATALLEEAIAKQAAEPTLEYADGTTQTQSEFVESYRAQFPGVSEEEAIATFNQYAQYNAMGHKVPGSAHQVSSGTDTNAPTKTKKTNSFDQRRSISGDKDFTGAVAVARAENIIGMKTTEAGREKARELTLKTLNNVAGKYGIKVEVRDPDGKLLMEGENGYYDAATKTIVLNSKRATTQWMMTYYFAHEITHPAEDAAKTKFGKDGKVKEAGLTDEIIAAMRTLEQTKGEVDKTIAETMERYRRAYEEAGRNTAQLKEHNFIEDEVACDFMMEAVGDRALFDKLAGVTPNPHRSLREKAKDFLKGKEKTEPGVSEAEKLIERVQASLEAAQKQGLKNSENRSTIEAKEREVRHSVRGNEESTDHRGRQDAGRVGGQGHLRHSSDESDASRGVLGSGDLGVHAGTLISELTRRIMDDKGISDVGLSETDDRSAFSVALDRAKAANPNGGMVDSQSVEGLTASNARTFMRPDGNAGVAVEDNGNIVGVFKHPSLRVPRVVQDLLLTAVAQGGNHLDCYATYGSNDLRSKYVQLGFEPVAWLEFNREYAPEDWDYVAWGEPDVVMFVHNGDPVEQIIGREDPYRVWTKDDIHALPKFEDYDEAKAYQHAELERRNALQAEGASKRYSIAAESASDGDNATASQDNRIRYSLDWNAQIDQLIAGDIDKTLKPLGGLKSVLYVMYEPTALLQQADLSDLPLITTQKHTRQMLEPRITVNGKVITPHAHQLTEAQVRHLPDFIQSPLALFKSDPRSKSRGGIVILTAETDSFGDPVIVTIAPDQARFNYNGTLGPAHFVNMYGFSNAENWMETLFRNSAVIYLNEEKINAELDPHLAQIIAGHCAKYGVDYNRIIRSKDPTVNPGPRRFSISPETGYEEGSVEDKVLKLLKAGSIEDAIAHLEQWAADVEAGRADAAEADITLRDALFTPRRATPEEAARNRAKLDELVKKYGAIEPGEKRARPVFFPNKVDDYTAVSKYARTVAEAKQTPEWFKEQVEQNIANSEAGFTHEIATDKKAMEYIEGRKKVSFEANLRTWEGIVEGRGAGTLGGITKNDIALGEYLYTAAVNAGDVTTATKLVAELAAVGTAAGQAVQAMSLLKKLGPAGQMYYLQRTIDRLNNSYQKRIDSGKMSSITVDADLAQAIFDAKTTEEAQAAMDALLQDVANQVPSTFMEKWNAWRYLAMLGNPRTHIRNLASNAIFGPVTWLKDVVGAVTELPLKRENRTKHLGEAFANVGYVLTGGKVKSDEYIQFADADYATMGDTLRGGGKYNPADIIRDKKPVFKSKPGQVVNWLSDKNSKLLEAEDAIFLKIHYVRAMSQYLAAQKADTATLENTPDGRNLLAKARSYAIKEAQKATFRDASALANALSRLERSGTAGQLIVGGIMPFKKTPINILKRGAEYSPLGVVNVVKQMTKGKENAAQTLDALASTLTGTGIMMLGAYLVKEGLLRAGGSDDEKEREFEELQGAQKYSITLDDGTSYTIDWMAPAALPLFVGAEWASLKQKDGELSASDLADMLMLLAEPMFQLSMLDGLNQTLSSAGYSDNPLSAVAASTLTSYIGQAVPTLLGQVARTMDGTRRTTYIDKNEDNVDVLERFKQYTQTKIPVASENLVPKLDAWGRTDTQSKWMLGALENFLSPGYANQMKTSAMEDELQRLYTATGANVLPRSMSKYFNVDKVRRDLTADEWVTYQTEAGQGAYEMLTRLTSSKAYQSLSDAQRVKAIEDVYTYTGEKAKEAAVSEYATDKSWIAKADKLADSGLSVEDYIVQSVLGEETSGQNTKDVMGMNWLSDTEKALLVSAAYGKSLTNGNTFTDPNRSGYAYTMTDAQTNQYLSYYDELWMEEYNELISRTRYTKATLEEKANMVDELKSEVADDTKRWMARQLRQAGVRSTKKD